MALDRLQDAPKAKAVIDFTMILAQSCNDDPSLRSFLKTSGAITFLRTRSAELNQEAGESQASAQGETV